MRTKNKGSTQPKKRRATLPAISLSPAGPELWAQTAIPERDGDIISDNVDRDPSHHHSKRTTDENVTESNKQHDESRSKQNQPFAQTCQIKLLSRTHRGEWHNAPKLSDRSGRKEVWISC